MSNYLHLLGASGEFPTWTWPAAHAGETVVEIEAHIRLGVNTSGDCLTQMGVWNTRGFRVDADNTNARFYVFGSGTQVVISEAHGKSAGDEFYLKATHNASGDMELLISDNGESWTSLGTDTSTGITPVGPADSDNQSIGAFAGAAHWNGGIHYLLVTSNGTTILDIDFRNLTVDELEAKAFTEGSANAKTITLNGDEWAYVRYRPTIAGKTPELLLEASDGNKGFSPKWADRSGNNHHAQRGSAAGADTNDPLFKRFDGEQYLYLPGSASNYASTPDVNLLDADTGHNQQSRGGLTSLFRFSSSGLVASSEAEFGDYVSRHVRTATSTAFISTASEWQAVAAATTYVWSTRIWITDGASASVQLGVNEWTGASADLGQTLINPNETLVDGWNTLTFDFTTDATTATVRFRIYEYNGAVDDVLDIDWSCLRTGSDGTFVPSLRIVGDLEVEAKVAADDWTLGGGGAGYQYVFGTLATSLAATDGGWHLSISDVGAVTIMHSDAALADLRTEQSALYTLVDGEATTIKITFDNSGLVTYYQDGVEVDDDVVTNTGAAGGGTSPLNVGTFDGAAVRMFNGDIYYCIARDGIGGPIVAEYRASDASEPFATHTGAQDGRTWTHNRSASGLVSTVVDRDMFLLTTDDYFTIADDDALDFGAGEDYTVLIATRSTFTTGNPRLLSKARYGSVKGYAIYRVNATTVGTFNYDGSSSILDSAVGTFGARTLQVAGARRTSGSALEAFLDGTGSGSPGVDTGLDLASTEPLYIGREVSAPAFEGQVVAVALFREALTDEEILAVGNALAGEGGAVNMMLMGVA